MPGKVQPVPQGYHTATPFLVCNDAARAIDFYKRAFDAKERFRMEGPPGKIGHAELEIGDSRIMLADEMPQMAAKAPQSLGGTTSGIFLYVKDADTVFNKAVSAGAKVETPLTNKFWGDRYGSVTDPFGHSWSIATHIEDVAPEEIEKRAKAEMAGSQGAPRTRTAG